MQDILRKLEIANNENELVKSIACDSSAVGERMRWVDKPTAKFNPPFCVGMLALTLRKVSFLFFCALLLLVFAVQAETGTSKKKINVLLYGGKYSETDLLPILLSQKTSYRESYVGVIGLNYPLGYKIRFLDFETEALFTKHFGLMKHWEFDGLMIARISNLFYLPISFAFGEGISLASQNPVLENKAKGFYFETGLYQFQAIESRNILNYVMVELDYRLWNADYNPRIFMRIHHRSGVFGLFCPPDPACGSNFVTYGVKFAY